MRNSPAVLLLLETFAAFTFPAAFVATAFVPPDEAIAVAGAWILLSAGLIGVIGAPRRSDGAALS